MNKTQTHRRRRLLKKMGDTTAGRRRKFLICVDDTSECRLALRWACRRARATGGEVALLRVVEPGDFQHWLGVKEIQREEAMQKARAVFRLFRRKLKSAGFDDITVEEVIREGKTADELMKLISEDEDIAIVVLGASVEQSGPGPLITNLLTGGNAGNFPIPISIIPGNLSWEEITALA